MRDLLAVAGVILLALGLGGAAAYLSVDLTPAAFEWARQAAIIAPAPTTEEAIRAEVKSENATSSCKYCSDIANLAQAFARRAEAARTHAEALQAAMSETADGQTAKTPATVAEYQAARTAAARAASAASVLTTWASRCESEDFCRAKPQQVTKAAACSSAEDAQTAHAQQIALLIKKTAQSCAAAACPAADCEETSALRSDVAAIGASLTALAGPVRMSSTQTPPSQLPVGASTVEAELSRVIDEAGYVVKMFPLLLDKTNTGPSADLQLPKLAPDMVNERAESVAQLSTVMDQSASVAPAARDVRPEASWRLKALAVNMAALGEEAKRAAGNDATSRPNWEHLAQSLGGSMMDIARLQAMVDRMRAEAPVPGHGCDGTVAEAAQQIREALSALDLCRMRSACVDRGETRRDTLQNAAAVTNADEKTQQATARAALFSLIPRAETAAGQLAVNDIGQAVTMPAANESEMTVLATLRARGVCQRASDLREAAKLAPAVTRQVASVVTAPATAPAVAIPVATPATVAASASAAVTEAATNTIAPPIDAQGSQTLAETITRFTGAAPRSKPAEQVTTAVETPAEPAETQPTFASGSSFTPGGAAAGLSFVGGPQQIGAPGQTGAAMEESETAPMAEPAPPAAPAAQPAAPAPAAQPSRPLSPQSVLDRPAGP